MLRTVLSLANEVINPVIAFSKPLLKQIQSFASPPAEIKQEPTPTDPIRQNIVDCLRTRSYIFIYFFNGRTFLETQILDKEFFKATGITPEHREQVEKLRPNIFILAVKLNELLNRHSAVEAFQYMLQGDPRFDEVDGKRVYKMRRFIGLLDRDKTLINFFFDRYPEIYLFFAQNIHNLILINDSIRTAILASKAGPDPVLKPASKSPENPVSVTLISSSGKFLPFQTNGTSYQSTIRRFLQERVIQYDTETAPPDLLEQVKLDMQKQREMARPRLTKFMVHEIKTGHDYQDAFNRVVKNHTRETSKEQVRKLAAINPSLFSLLLTHEATLLAIFLESQYQHLGAFFNDYFDSIERDHSKKLKQFFDEEAEATISIYLSSDAPNPRHAFEMLLAKHGFERRMTLEAVAYHTVKLKMDTDTNFVVRSFFNISDESTTLGEFFDSVCQKILAARAEQTIAAAAGVDSDDEEDAPKLQRTHSIRR